MTDDAGPRGKLTVVITDPPRPPKRYRRPFVGLTVAQAVGLLEKEDVENLDFPCVCGGDWFLNREAVYLTSLRVLHKGDVLKLVDPPKNH